jgi:hypothetical protein
MLTREMAEVILGAIDFTWHNGQNGVIFYEESDDEQADKYDKASNELLLLIDSLYPDLFENFYHCKKEIERIKEV